MYKTLTVAKELEGLTDEERAKYAQNEFTCDIYVNGEPYNGSDTIRYDATGSVIEEGFEIVNGKVNLKPGERVRIIGLQPNDTFYAAEENGLSMTEFYPPRAERFYQDNNKQQHEEEVDLTEEQQNGEISDWKTQTYPVENLEELMFTNTLREKNLDVEKTWGDGVSHANDEVKFKVRAKVTIDGEEYDYTDKISALYSDSTVSNRKIQDVLSETYTLNAANEWKAQLEHLPAVNNVQQEITYEIIEVQTANGYVSSVTGVDSHNIDVVKIFPEDHAFTDEEIQFKLKKDGLYYNGANNSWGNAGNGTIYTLNASNNYTYRFHDMPAGEYSYEEIGNNQGNDNPLTDGLVVYDRKLKKFDILNSPFNINVGKIWDPAKVANENVEGRKVEVTLGRYILMDLKGNLTIRKEGVPTAADFRANYTVINTDTNEVFGVYPYVPGGITVSVPAGNYSISETILEDDDTYNHTHTTASPQTRVVQDGGASEVVFNSSYTPKMGKLQIKSSLTPNDTGMSYAGVTYEIYDLHGNRVEGIDPITFAEASSENGKTVNIKIGNYTVREVGAPATPAGMKATLKPKSDDGKAREVGVIVNEGDEASLAEFKATYKWENAKVTVTCTNNNVTTSQDGFRVGDTVRITYKCNNSETIGLPTVTGGTLLSNSPVQDQEPNGWNSYNGTYHVDVKITSKNVTAAFTNPGIGNNWSAMSTNPIEITLVSHGTPASVQASPRMMMKAPLRATTQNYETEDVTNTAQPPEAPSGKKYVEDTSFTHDVITLNYGNNWTEAVADLASTDANGNPYYYYIKSVHEENMPQRTTGEITLNGENLLLVGAGDTTPLTVKNTVILPGSLKIKKTFNGITVNDFNNVQLSGLSFTISGPDNYSRIVSWSELDNNQEITISDLAPGEYIVNEIRDTASTPEGWIFKSTTYSVENGQTTVASEQTSEVIITNSYEKLTDITVKKVDAEKLENNVQDRTIGGAKFIILDGEGHSVSEIPTIVVIDAVTEDVITLDSEGKFIIPLTGVRISGLPNGSYQLVEREAPDGYVIENPITSFTVLEGSVISWTLTGDAASIFEIPNPAGVALPNTGGPGTRLFTILGSILILGAGVLLWRRRRLI